MQRQFKLQTCSHCKAVCKKLLAGSHHLFLPPCPTSRIKKKTIHWNKPVCKRGIVWCEAAPRTAQWTSERSQSRRVCDVGLACSSGGFEGRQNRRGPQRINTTLSFFASTDSAAYVTSASKITLMTCPRLPLLHPFTSSMCFLLPFMSS